MENPEEDLKIIKELEKKIRARRFRPRTLSEREKEFWKRFEEQKKENKKNNVSNI